MLVRVRERHPFADVWSLDRDVDRIFRAAFGAPTRGPRAVDVNTDAEGVTVRAELPGVDPAHINVAVENGVLTITAERNEAQRDEGTALVRERAYGKFAQSFRLADDLDADAVSADCRDGVLTIRVPRRAAAKPRQIEVKTN
jgi:HSP20 family protein